MSGIVLFTLGESERGQYYPTLNVLSHHRQLFIFGNLEFTFIHGWYTAMALTG